MNDEMMGGGEGRAVQTESAASLEYTASTSVDSLVSG
jgi:hypothetical protein